MFSGTVYAHKNLICSQSHPLRSAADLRNAYDCLLWNDIKITDSENLPDGLLFRQHPVEVVGGKKIHSGLFPEQEIITTIQAGIEYLNDSEDPFLIKAAFFHFLIGYAHPFYDGNGRLNRFLSLQLLSSKLETIDLTQLSALLNQNRRTYYKVFKSAEDPLNKGDMGEFILFFLRILEQSILNVSAKIDDLLIRNKL